MVRSIICMWICMYVLLNSTGNQKFFEMFKIFSTHLHKLKSDHEFTCLVWVVPPSSRTIGSCWSQQKKISIITNEGNVIWNVKEIKDWLTFRKICILKDWKKKIICKGLVKNISELLRNMYNSVDPQLELISWIEMTMLIYNLSKILKPLWKI